MKNRFGQKDKIKAGETNWGTVGIVESKVIVEIFLKIMGLLYCSTKPRSDEGTRKNFLFHMLTVW